MRLLRFTLEPLDFNVDGHRIGQCRDQALTLSCKNWTELTGVSDSVCSMPATQRLCVQDYV
jgi:hypothetical protein